MLQQQQQLLAQHQQQQPQQEERQKRRRRSAKTPRGAKQTKKTNNKKKKKKKMKKKKKGDADGERKSIFSTSAKRKFKLGAREYLEEFGRKYVEAVMMDIESGKIKQEWTPTPEWLANYQQKRQKRKRQPKTGGASEATEDTNGFVAGKRRKTESAWEDGLSADENEQERQETAEDVHARDDQGETAQDEREIAQNRMKSDDTKRKEGERGRERKRKPNRKNWRCQNTKRIPWTNRSVSMKS